MKLILKFICNKLKPPSITRNGKNNQSHKGEGDDGKGKSLGDKRIKRLEKLREENQKRAQHIKERKRKQLKTISDKKQRKTQRGMQALKEIWKYQKGTDLHI